MKKIVIVLLAVFCFSTPNVSYGEAGLWKKFVSSYKRYFEKGTGSRSKILQPKQLEIFVRKRAADSQKELKNMPWNLMYRNEQPALQIKGWSKYMSKALCPNTAWLQTIQNYRKKYPEALFIIHAGAWHTGYIMPFSLANAFNPTETFVVHFIASRSALLDILSDNQVRAPVLAWKDKNLAHIAGFDVQITTGL